MLEFEKKWDYWAVPMNDPNAPRPWPSTRDVMGLGRICEKGRGEAIDLEIR